jgi:hypothetical protein
VSGPLVVGQFYLVPTVHTTWCGTAGDWPVIGPEHNDIEFFHFTTMHYHVDARFLPPNSTRIHQTLSYPLHARHPPYAGKKETLPKPVWRRRKCHRASIGFNPYDPRITIMRQHYAGRQCARNSSGFVCPHRHAPLGSIVPVNGVITCPLHALKIDAITGIVLAPGRE